MGILGAGDRLRAGEAGRAILGAIRRGETIPDVSEMEEIYASIKEHFELMAAAEEEERSRRQEPG